MNNIQNPSKRINKFLSVFFWCCVVSMVLVAIWTIVIFVGKGAVGAELETSLTLGDYKLTLADGYPLRDNPITLVNNISVILTLAMVLFEIKVLKEIFSPMASGLPFQGSVSKAIRKMAWIVLIYGAIGTVVKSITSRLLYQLLDIPSLFSPGKVSACSISIKSSGNFVVVFVLLILLSRIFKYGEELQQLSDETL